LLPWQAFSPLLLRFYLLIFICIIFISVKVINKINIPKYPLILAFGGSDERLGDGKTAIPDAPARRA
jgi:hypothetical protein